MHPAHHPLHAEAQAAVVRRVGHAHERSRFLGDRDDVRMIPVRRFVHHLEELDRLDVLAAAVLVRRPLAFLAGIVEVDHRRNGIDAEAIGVKFVDPVECVADEERLDLVTAVIEDEALPVGMEALLRVRVFVDMRAVEEAEAVAVGREMRGHPIEDNADVVPVQGVDQVLEVLRRPEPAGRGKIARDLVAPRRIVRVLHDRHEFHVRKAHVFEVGRQDIREFSVAVGRAVLLLAPGGEVHLVDRHRRTGAVAGMALAHPIRILPGIVVGPNVRGRIGRCLVLAAVGVGLRALPALVGFDRVFIEIALFEARDESFPDA